MSAHALAATPQPEPHGEGAATRGKRLSFQQRALIVSLRKLDHTHDDIAASLGISSKSVARVLNGYGADLKQHTQELLQTGVIDRLDNWHRAARVAAKKGDHRPAKDWLLAAQAIDAEAQTLNVNFQAVVAPRPGLPAFAQPVLEAEAVPVPARPATPAEPATVLTTSHTQRPPLSAALKNKVKRLRR